MPVASPRPWPLRAAAPHRVLRGFALALGLIWGGASVARAQSLLELYEAARPYDASYLAAKAQADSVVYRARQADALMLPNAALTGTGARVETNPIGATGAFGAGGATDPYGSNSTSLAITARQPLFNPANVATIAQAQRSLEAATATLAAADQDLIIRVAQAYFDVLGAQDTLSTTRTSKVAIAEQLASAKRNFEVGTATITDTREAQARFDLATAQEVIADNDLVTKRIALDQLVGRRNVVPNQLLVPVVLPALPGSMEDWVARTDTGHPQVRQAQVALDTARLETDKARAGNWPTVDAIASVNTRRDNTPTLGYGNNTSGSLGVQINVPLFSGFSVQNRIKETLALEEKSRNDLDTARRSVTQTTRQAYYSVLSGAAQVKALEAAESSSQLALEATQLGYRVGVRVNIDVLNAQTQLFTTRRDLARARYDVLVGNLRLRQAAGQLNPSDVAAINQLLAK